MGALDRDDGRGLLHHADDRGGAPGVGRAVNDTVVIAATTFIVVNYFLTSALFGAIG
jgi:ABC-type transporter Mla maintaining outer membrane lipid asymmetry permease subunit MlaE